MPYKICERCGKRFHVRPSRMEIIHFCSRDCSTPPVIKVCERCGKEFRIPPCRRDTACFCSWECRYSLGIKKICERCGKDFVVPPHRKARRFCSWECRAPPMLKICEQCGKEFRVPPSQANRRRFCSRICANPHREINTCIDCGKPITKEAKRCSACEGLRRRKRVKRNCQWCGKEFQATPGQIGRGRGIFCSTVCRLTYLHQEILPHFPSPTSIELAMRRALLSQGWIFLEQCPLLSRYVVDFCLPLFRIVIECDGDYWHSRIEIREHDAHRDHLLVRAGWMVLRFSGSEIREDIEACIRTIQAAIKHPST